MAKVTNWQELQADFSETDLAGQITVAKVMNIAVPEEALQQHAREEAAAQARANVTVTYGSQRQPDRVYVSSKQGEMVSPLVSGKGNAQRTKGLYLEVRALDERIATLQALRADLKAAGFHTSPTDAKQPGPEAAQALGFKVVVTNQG